MNRSVTFLAVAVALTLSGCSYFTADSEPVVTVAPTPTPTPTPVRPDPLPPATPITTQIGEVALHWSGNEGLFGRTVDTTDATRRDVAVADARTVLDQYLNAILIAPETQFTELATAGIIVPGTASPEILAALGVLPDTAALVGTEAGTSTADAVVLETEEAVESVTLWYDAAVEATVWDGETTLTGPVGVSGMMTVSFADNGVHVVEVESALTVSEQLEGVLR